MKTILEIYDAGNSNRNLGWWNFSHLASYMLAKSLAALPNLDSKSRRVIENIILWLARKGDAEEGEELANECNSVLYGAGHPEWQAAERDFLTLAEMAASPQTKWEGEEGVKTMICLYERVVGEPAGQELMAQLTHIHQKTVEKGDVTAA